jgi:hypothetical protein
MLPGSRHLLLGTIPLLCHFLVSVGEYIYIYILGFVHIIVKVEDTLAQLTVWFFTLDNYMLFFVNEKVKLYIYILRRMNENSV